MNYQAEEVRAIARRLHDDITVRDGDALTASDMLTAYADSIERAVPVAKIRHFHYSGVARNGLSQEAQMLDGAPELPDGTELFTHPPAQAAQVDPAAKPHTLADFVHAPDAERAQIGQQVAARVDEMMAEPVAQAAQSVDVEAIREVIKSDNKIRRK